MASVGDLEVFIPVHSHAITLPVRLLPSSIIRKIVTCPGDSERQAVFISPVELREKGATPRPRPLTPGQILLPVVTSNSRAFRMLQNFLQSGAITLQFSAENSRCVFSRRKNSIILFNSKIFLIEPKASKSDWLRQKRSSAPSVCEAPPPNTPVKKQNDDITERRSEDGTGAAEDHGKWHEREADANERKEEKQEVLMKDVSTNTPRIKLEKAESGIGAAGSSERGHANETISASANQKSSSDPIKMSESSNTKADCRKRLVFTAVQSSSETNANQSRDKNEVKGQISDSEIGNSNANDREDAAKSESYVEVQSHGGQSSRCESAVEIIDVTDGDNNNSDQENANVAHVSRVENLLKTCERIQHRINAVTSMGSVFEHKISHNVAMETSAGHDDLIIVDEPDRHVSVDKRHVNRTSVKLAADARVLLSRSDSRACPSTSRDRCESTVEIVDLHHDIIIEDGEVGYSHGHENGDKANKIKRRIEDQTKISEVGGSSAKRCKREAEANPLSERKRLDNVDPNSQAQSDVRMIEVVVDDDDDDETMMSRHFIPQMNEGIGGGEASGRELPGPRHVSHSDRSDETKADAGGGDEVQRIKAEDASAQRNLQEHEVVLMKVPSGFSEVGVHEAESSSRESEVVAVKLHPDDWVLHESSQESDGDDAEGCVECDISEVPSEEASEMKEARDEEEPVSSSEKRQNVSGTCCESHDHKVLSAAEDGASGSKPAEGVSSPAASEHHKFTAQRSGATNQSASREEASVLPRPASSPANHEMNYVVLRREENINRIRERLRRMEEKLNAMKNSH